MDKEETFVTREVVLFPEDFLAKGVEIVLVEVVCRFGEGERIQLLHHPFFHFGSGVVGESDSQNMLISST